ncbi:MAG TPA: class I SAM-dependent RNA methyltransferase [Stellaceae bacterium]|nr:class I SAM-dependent RNA methyltransferase [Stellaceae bacterium]
MAAPAFREELVELTVKRIGSAGDGVADWRGTPVYLPFTVPGDRVRARLGARRGGGREGRVVELVAAGPGRATPPCRHFGSCGGCALQHLDRATYQATKLDGLYRALQRSGIDPGVVAPLRTVAPARRRARLGLARPADPRQPGRVGFHRRRHRDLVDLDECPVLVPALFTIIAGLRRLVPELLRPGGTAAAILTRTDSGIDLLIEGDDQPGQDAFEALGGFADHRDLARIVWRSGEDESLVVERRTVRIVCTGVAVELPPGAFLQASEAAEASLVAEIVNGIGPDRPALDLYAGLGTFAFALAGQGAVHAVEGDARSAAALAAAARGVPGVTVERRDLARAPLPPEMLAGYAAAVLDPPRAGAISQAAAFAASNLGTVAAVSCNPATFARDAAQLIAGGFRLERVVPIDQFVWSPHLELVGLFRR